MHQTILNFAILWALILVIGGFFRETHDRRITLLITGTILANILSLSTVVLYNYGIIIEQPLLRAIMMTFPFFIGPFYYSYFCTVFGHQGRGNMLLHFLPAVAAFLLLAALSFSFGTLPGDKGMVIRKSIFFVQLLHILAYYFLTARMLNGFRGDSKEAAAGMVLTAAYSLTFISAVVGILLVSGPGFFELLTVLYAYNSLVFTAHYLIAQKYPVLFALYVQCDDHRGEKRSEKTRYDVDAQRVAQELKHAMEIEKLFLVEDITLTMLAYELGLRPYQLSYFLNKHLHKNFYSLINSYRVEEAKSILAGKPERSVISVAFDSGFSSKSSFNRVFQNATGMTPTEFREMHSMNRHDSSSVRDRGYTG